jgi:hypothetical protein
MGNTGVAETLMRLIEPVATALDLFGVAVIIASVRLATFRFVADVRATPVATA